MMYGVVCHPGIFEVPSNATLHIRSAAIGRGNRQVLSARITPLDWTNKADGRLNGMIRGTLVPPPVFPLPKPSPPVFFIWGTRMFHFKPRLENSSLPALILLQNKQEMPNLLTSNTAFCNVREFVAHTYNDLQHGLNGMQGSPATRASASDRRVGFSRRQLNLFSCSPDTLLASISVL